MTKRIIAVVLAAVLLLAAVPAPSAVEADPDGINASKYLSGYGAYLHSNGNSGTLKLSYEVYATGYMDIVGIFKILVRNSDGSIYRTIWGSVANGLEATNAVYKIGNYTLTNLVSGNQYYCSVTVIAMNSTGSDTRTVNTALVTCP